jgi:hypothetical protein
MLSYDLGTEQMYLNYTSEDKRSMSRHGLYSLLDNAPLPHGFYSI